MSYLEIIDPTPAGSGPVKHVVFDHDGTLSTIRYNWESIMEPMMINAVLGGAVVSGKELDDITSEIREFIDKTTGIQTLRQMQGLVDLVKRWNVNPTILDAFGYKKIYNDELMAMVNRRLEPLRSERLDASDFEIKNATDLLMKLWREDVSLHLASGTDQDDVVREADALGYGWLFEGRIHGSVNKLEVEAKQVVLQRIFDEVKSSDGRIIVVGDGPVEIQEGRKVGALTIGVASDECRRHGLNQRKRKRLIDAGAHAIVPDFSDLDALLDYMFHATDKS
jgi:phosphoglycolate phosphatase-like HAD superfamily hydrolase